MSSSTNKNLLTLLIVVVVIAALYSLLVMPDQRTPGQRIGDAVDALPQGPDKAARELEQRTPGQKIGDAVKDAGDNIKRDTAPTTQ